MFICVISAFLSTKLLFPDFSMASLTQNQFVGIFIIAEILTIEVNINDGFLTGYKKLGIGLAIRLILVLAVKEFLK